MKVLGRLRKAFSRLARGERGFSLVEVVVAVAILGIVGVGFMSALATGYLALLLADESTIGESLTRGEFEDIRNDKFKTGADNYTSTRGTEIGYRLQVTVDDVGEPSDESPRQLWTVTVYHSSDNICTQEEWVLTTKTYKVENFKEVVSGVGQ